MISGRTVSNNLFFNFEAKNLDMVILWCIAEVSGKKYFCSLDFQVKNVSNMLAASLMALVLLRERDRIQDSKVFNRKQGLL